jgi:hypothetical protein
MYLKLTNGVPVMYTLGQLRRDNPQTSFPKVIPDDLLASYAVYPYTRPTTPAYDPLAWTLVDDEFVNTDGAWALPFRLEQLPQEQAERNIRSRRDSLLQETDWIVTRSYERGEPVPANWVSYRQALRDITAQAGFPYSVEWPTKP